MIGNSLFTAFLAGGLILALVSRAGAQNNDNVLKDPASLNAIAPEEFKVKFDTTAGEFIVEVYRDWAPHGADRFYNLAKNGFFDEVRFFRVIEGFMVQFGIHGDPTVASRWREARIPVDPVTKSNRRGYITYAMAGSPDTRTTQVFINFSNNNFLDRQGFAPFGRVTEGMRVVDKIYDEYGEGAPRGKGPSQGRVQGEGNAYLETDFPQLDYIRSATIDLQQ